ncbi:MAG: hypothetical protein M3032_00160 [Verrucomicrobiota bacterium]|nr:hypothetical protein [Verrucomicrobiota bacterium]
MKTLEEKWTAWIDGQLTGKELIEFEATLPDKAAAETEKDDALKLGAFLKKEIGAPAMTNEEFFHHQLRQAIARDETEETTATAKPARESWWSIGRLVWAGAASMAVFVVCTFFVLREQPNAGQSGYLTQITNAKIDPVVSPGATISVFPVDSEKERVTVIWIDGLQTLPSEYAAK